MNEGTSLRAKRIFELLQKKYDCTLIKGGSTIANPTMWRYSGHQSFGTFN